jgi:hypothetical protein
VYGRKFHGDGDGEPDALDHGDRDAADGSDFQQWEWDGNTQRDTSGGDGGELHAYDYSEQRSGHERNAKFHADGQPGESGAGDHEREQHDIRGGYGRKFHGDSDGEPDAVDH